MVAILVEREKRMKRAEHNRRYTLPIATQTPPLRCLVYPTDNFHRQIYLRGPFSWRNSLMFPQGK